MARPFVTCEADHPGVHRQTSTCLAPERELVGDRLIRWLEEKLNPRRVGPRPECPWCGNWLITRQGNCAYCEEHP